MDQGLAALLGALIGGLSAFLAAWRIEVQRERRLARNAAVASACEVDALLMLIKARKWRDSFVQYKEVAEQGTVVCLQIPVHEKPLPLTRQAVMTVGAIDPELVVYMSRLVTVADALTADLRRLYETGVDEPRGLLTSDDPEFAASLYGEMIQLLDAGFEVGSRLVSVVDRRYPRPKDSLGIRTSPSA